MIATCPNFYSKLSKKVKRSMDDFYRIWDKVEKGEKLTKREKEIWDSSLLNKEED